MYAAVCFTLHVCQWLDALYSVNHHFVTLIKFWYHVLVVTHDKSRVVRVHFYAICWAQSTIYFHLKTDRAGTGRLILACGWC